MAHWPSCTLVNGRPRLAPCTSWSRPLSAGLSDKHGQQIVVDNRASPGGLIAAETVARATPDGYTLLMGTTGTHSTNPAVYPKLPYDPLKDFAPISLVAECLRKLIS